MLIKTIDMCRVYQSGNNTVEALSHINLDIADGEFVSVVGASGSGKSTLMNILGLLDLPDSGEYYFENNEIRSFSDRQISKIRNEKIGFVFQSFNLIHGLSVLENVSLPLEYRGVSAKKRTEIAGRALEIVGMGGRIQHKPSELSGGQQQRAAIARAIAAEPELILADEPCGNLDSKAGNEIMTLLSRLNKQGKTVILITHDINAAKAADRIIRVSDGRICE